MHIVILRTERDLLWIYEDQNNQNCTVSWPMGCGQISWKIRCTPWTSHQAHFPYPLLLKYLKFKSVWSLIFLLLVYCLKIFSLVKRAVVLQHATCGLSHLYSYKCHPCSNIESIDLLANAMTPRSMTFAIWIFAGKQTFSNWNQWQQYATETINLHITQRSHLTKSDTARDILWQICNEEINHINKLIRQNYLRKVNISLRRDILKL